MVTPRSQRRGRLIDQLEQIRGGRQVQDPLISRGAPKGP
jgi:hypothetical protein